MAKGDQIKKQSDTQSEKRRQNSPSEKESIARIRYKNTFLYANAFSKPEKIENSEVAPTSVAPEVLRGQEIKRPPIQTMKIINGGVKELTKKVEDPTKIEGNFGYYKEKAERLLGHVEYVKLCVGQDKHKDIDKFVEIIKKGIELIKDGNTRDWRRYQPELSKEWKNLDTALRGNERELIENCRKLLCSRDGAGIDHYSIAYNTVVKNCTSKLVETIGSTLRSIADILKENKDSKDPQAVIDKCNSHLEDLHNAIYNSVNGQLILFAGTKNALADALVRANKTSALGEHEVAVKLMPAGELGECETALRGLRMSLDGIFDLKYTQTIAKRWYVRGLEEGSATDVEKNQHILSPQEQLDRAIQGFLGSIDSNSNTAVDVKKSQESSSSQDKIQQVRQGFSGPAPMERWVAGNPNQRLQQIDKHLIGLPDKKTEERPLGDAPGSLQRKPSDKTKTVTEAWESVSQSWEKFRRKLEPIIPEETLPENWRSVVQICKSPESITSGEALLEKCKKEKASESITSGEPSLENQEKEKDIVYVLQKIMEWQREMVGKQQERSSSHKNSQPAQGFVEKHRGPTTPQLRARL